MRAVLASANPHKARELGDVLDGWEIEPLGAALPEETGSTFSENARAKATFARAVVGPDVLVLGEDSGLEVEALNGAPGVRSARYAGVGASDADNVARLLADLRNVPPERRAARFVAEIVCLLPGGGDVHVRGSLDGFIAFEPLGSDGFGYDPIFVPVGEQETVAELGAAWKREHSHRARAGSALVDSLGARAESL
ncbi:MAG TPA: non-canonical purine NTP pyrophosphatase [Gaiellaceae bacterium]|nr:non-canonical purine NTP pyrophosphatase [Gaiellaceae bacterium]